MELVTQKGALRQALEKMRGARIVLVPTMGALHEGHASLLRQARALAGSAGFVVASIFLNPVQFNNPADLASYPSTPQDDLTLCESCGVDLVFMPAEGVMYEPTHSMRLEETSLSTQLCGASRPGHFAGVCLVVHKLFNLVGASDAIFGKKDYQQLAIIRRMVRDMDTPITLHGAETVRAADGLALSSRNTRLSPEHRAAAPTIYASLQEAQAAYAAGATQESILAQVRARLEAIEGVQIDYAQIVDAQSLQAFEGECPLALLAIAAFFGEVRLIDNIELTRA